MTRHTTVPRTAPRGVRPVLAGILTSALVAGPPLATLAQDSAPTLPPITGVGFATPPSSVLPPENARLPVPQADVNAENSAASAPRLLSDVLRKGAGEIAKRQRTLADLAGKLAGQRADCGANGLLTAEVARTSASLAALGQQLAVTADLATARRLYQSIFIDHRVYILVQPKVGLGIRCDGQLLRTQALQTEAAKMQSTIDSLRARGLNVAPAQTAKDAALAALASVAPAGALTPVLGLAPDRGVQAVRDANAAALRQADAALDASAARQKDVDRQLDRVRSALRDLDRSADKAAKDLEKQRRKLEEEQRKELDRMRREDSRDSKENGTENRKGKGNGKAKGHDKDPDRDDD
jgi:hypothetical protein